jgi:hypothetical protein
LARGDLAGATEHFGQSQALAERIGNMAAQAEAWQYLGQLAWARGDLAAAAACCRDGLQLAEALGDQLTLTALYLSQGEIAGDQGAVRAAALLAHGRTLAVTHSLAEPALQAALLAAELQVRDIAAGHGSIAQALLGVEEALRLAIAGHRRREEALARRLAGQCALAGGDSATAEVHLQAALVMLTEMGALLEAARTRLALAEALAVAAQADGIPSDACTLLAEAQAQFAASGAALDLAQAQQQAAAWACGA